MRERATYTCLLHKARESLGGVAASGGRVVHVHPLAQQKLRFLVQARRVVELARLRDAGLHHGGGVGRDTAPSEANLAARHAHGGHQLFQTQI